MKKKEGDKMRLKARRFVPLLVFLVVMVGFFLLGFHQREETTSAKPTEFSFCNVSVRNIPPEVEAVVVLRPTQTEEEKFYLVLYSPLPVDERLVVDPTTERVEWVESHIAIDAMTGKVVEEYFDFSRPQEMAQLRAISSTLEVGALSADTPAWPLTETSPRMEKVEAVIEEGRAAFKYRPPEPGSGLYVENQHGTPNPGERLIARTCDSEIIVEEVIDPESGKAVDLRVTKDKVTPAEREMFDRFLEEVEGLK